MADNQVLIISFWNPTKENPQQGIFIFDQVSAVCRERENIVFLQVNVLPASHLGLKKTIKESPFFKNRLIEINLYTRLWKFLYVNPWLLAKIIYKIISRPGLKILPSIIHSNVIFPCGIVGYLLSQKTGALTLISEHWSKAELLLKKPVYKRIAKKAYEKCFAVIFVSGFLSKKIISATRQKNPLIIPNIIDTEIFKFKPKYPSENELCFLCVGTWRLPKRLDLIFNSLSMFANETGREIKLKVVGNGPQTEQFKGENIPGNLKIEWMGYQDKPSIASHLHETDIFIHASDIETFSIVIAEALSTGTPVLASNTGAIPELVNSSCGVLAENSPDAFLKSLYEIVSKKYEYSLIADLQKDKFSPKTVGAEINKIYEKTLAEEK